MSLFLHLSIIAFHVQLFFIMGLPAVITTDQGREFRNSLDAELMKRFGIQHRLTSPYHPQANGLDERFNQTITNALAKFSVEKREMWECYSS